MKKRFLAALLCLALALPISGLALATGVQTDPAETTTPVGGIMTAPSETTTVPAETTVASDETTTAAETTTMVPETTAGAEETSTTVPETTVSEREEPLPDIHTLVFTDAGPFLPPVNVAPVRRMAANRVLVGGGDEDKDNGLELSKRATANEDGTYTITMEAYTTGEVTTTTKTVPVDIVLVLDQSGSMAYNFAGESTGNIKAKRQYALKNAVRNFIDSVAGKYSEEADHRMAIVTFGGSAQTRMGWTKVDEDGQARLKGSVNSLPNDPSGATNAAAGMQQAESLMGAGYGYTGTNTERQKIVIVFTDGVPTTSTDFNTTVASNAIKSAKSLKDGGVTVYSIGIFNGADPGELYGEKWDYELFQDITCSGEVGSYWGESWAASIFGGNDFAGIDIAAGNRFLNYLSSNFMKADSVGLERGTYNPGGHILSGGTGYKIIENFGRSASNYYLTANDSASLNEIFQEISDNIEHATIDLDADTIVRDTVTPYFNLPPIASEIKVYTAEYDGTNFAERELSTLTATVEGSVVSVTGFDFNQNFVSETVKADGTYGRKLIIEFTVKPKNGFLGGNNVPTNGTASGVYDKDGQLIGSFDVPHVNVPVVKPTLAVTDKTIYLDGSEAVTVDELYTPFAVAEDWMDDFVTISYTKPASIDQTDCGDYGYAVTLTPDAALASSKGTPATAQTSDTATAHVHVLKPSVTGTVCDVEKYYGETYNLGDGAGGAIDVTWADTHTDHTPGTPEGTAPYGADDLELAYAAEGFTSGSALGKKDMDVTVSVVKKTDKTPVNAAITTTCAADVGCTTPDTDGKYTVHIKTCQLTLTKAGGQVGDTYVFHIKRDGQPYMTVQVTGNASRTVYELPVGTYTVEEEGTWSWRYDGVADKTATLSAQQDADTITCTNTPNNLIYWLNGYSAAKVNNPNAVAVAK